MFGAKRRLSVSRNYLLQNAAHDETPSPAAQSDLRSLPAGHTLPPLQQAGHASEARMKQMEDKIDLILDAMSRMENRAHSHYQ